MTFMMMGELLLRLITFVRIITSAYELYEFVAFLMQLFLICFHMLTTYYFLGKGFSKWPCAVVYLLLLESVKCITFTCFQIRSSPVNMGLIFLYTVYLPCANSHIYTVFMYYLAGNYSSDS